MTAVSWLAAAVAATVVGVLGVRLRTTTTPRRSVVAQAGSRWTLGWPALRRRSDTEPGNLQVAEWCERVAAAVRAGSSLTRAVVEAGDDVLSPFPGVAHAVRRGRGLAAALDELAVDPATARGLVVPVLAACAELGGPAAQPLERVAATLHARAAEHAERHVNSAQARLSARVLTTVPFGVVGLLALTEPSVRGALATPAGMVCLVLGAGLNLAGWWWMRSIIASAA
jgi:Flp pilus assembly protein TadB